MTGDWRLGLENTREGELYREKKRLEQEMEDAEWRRRRDDLEQEREHFRAEERRRSERESQAEQRMHLHDLIQARDEDIEDLKLRQKFGIEEGKP